MDAASLHLEPGAGTAMQVQPDVSHAGELGPAGLQDGRVHAMGACAVASKALASGTCSSKPPTITITPHPHSLPHLILFFLCRDCGGVGCPKCADLKGCGSPVREWGPPFCSLPASPCCQLGARRMCQTVQWGFHSFFRYRGPRSLRSGQGCGNRCTTWAYLWPRHILSTSHRGATACS